MRVMSHSHALSNTILPLRRTLLPRCHRRRQELLYVVPLALVEHAKLAYARSRLAEGQLMHQSTATHLLKQLQSE